MTSWRTNLIPVRIGLFVLIAFELLGALRLIPIVTEFTWKGLLLQSIAIWVFIEWAAWYVRRRKLNYFIAPAAYLLTLQVIVDAVGDMAHLYGKFIWYDQLMHLTGGFVVAFITTGILYAMHRRDHVQVLSLREVLLTGWSLGVTAQVIYELEEYMEDVLTGSHRLGDGFDTANDLMLGSAGGAIAAILVLALPRITSRR
jgi:hypothetical protein